MHRVIWIVFFILGVIALAPGCREAPKEPVKANLESLKSRVPPQEKQ